MQAGERHTFWSAFEYAGDVLIAPLNGKECKIVRQLDETEHDNEECGEMFVVVFDDGTEIHAYDDELDGGMIRSNPWLFPVAIGGTKV